MPRQFIKRVTVTGADNTTNIKDMLQLSNKYPYLEWGILLSKKRAGHPRFPSISWLNKLYDAKFSHPTFTLSGHICGQWIRDICSGIDVFHDNVSWESFDRYQLNFHGELHRCTNMETVALVISQASKDDLHRRPVIIQVDGVNDPFYHHMLYMKRNVLPLFDRSGGAGIVPNRWPAPIGPYCGYAGGLSPENVLNQIQAIGSVVGGDTIIWIDAETGLRDYLPSADGVEDAGLNMERVELYVSLAQPYVTSKQQEGE